MEASSDLTRLVDADRPFFTTREDLDDMQSLSSVTFARGDISIGRYRRDRPGLGVTTPNPLTPMVMAVVILRPRLASSPNAAVFSKSTNRTWSGNASGSVRFAGQVSVLSARNCVTDAP